MKKEEENPMEQTLDFFKNMYLQNKTEVDKIAKEYETDKKKKPIKKDLLFKLWAYDAEAKMWASGKDQIPNQNLNMIEIIQKKTEDIRTQLYEFILTVEDPYYRVLLNYRCIERRSWKWIARMLGGSAESHRKALARFIEEI